MELGGKVAADRLWRMPTSRQPCRSSVNRGSHHSQNGGQTCSAGSRVLIEENRSDDRVASALAGAPFAKLVAGPHEAIFDLWTSGQTMRQPSVSRQLGRDAMIGGRQRFLARGSVHCAGRAGWGGFLFRHRSFSAAFDRACRNRPRGGLAPSSACSVSRPGGGRAPRQMARMYVLVAGIWTIRRRRQHRVGQWVLRRQVSSSTAMAPGGWCRASPLAASASGHGSREGLRGAL